ncbi:DUF6483 family protein [Ruminococcus flavefaciens]|jgi:hypothetical protein|uniref:DUF6483 family protein n=1 Tax=Ruminococcus flavefaciens TaxID=1265 RepID=UPI0026EB72D9|nr:DUF6483 family protein [Ruminococcus flavefaciens]MDD7517007.1 DUF6483 family protein [Ruminococcus flavefaciens]MDY5692364.1 DUF6483 family protein [Ruminococcus flavefaciens]
MFEQDYIMRQIKEMTAFIAKILFGANIERSLPMLQEIERQKLFGFVERMHNGEIQEACDDVNKLADNNTKENLLIGLEFYSQLSDMDDAFFAAKGYNFAKARKSFRTFAEKYGLQQMTNLYFGDGNDDDE